MEAEGKIVAIVADEELQGAITSGTDAILVLDQTPFYAEMGGQVADHGTIHTETAEFTVTDVQKNKGGKFMHYGKLVSGSLAVGDTVTASAGLCSAHGSRRPCPSGRLPCRAGPPALRLYALLRRHRRRAGQDQPPCQ